MLYRCWQLKEGLRDLFRLRRIEDAPEHLDWWLAWACRSRIPAFVTLSRTAHEPTPAVQDPPKPEENPKK
ncbi:MAG: transposase [Actinobacteria bacterium]|nr:transposase [Actinomycetota bacterium]